LAFGGWFAEFYRSGSSAAVTCGRLPFAGIYTGILCDMVSLTDLDLALLQYR